MSKDFSFDDDDDDKPKRRSKSRRDEDDDDDDAPPRRRSEGKRSSGQSKSWVGIFRFITPGTFGMAVLFFFLPWSDLSCNGPTGRMQLVTQSGFQAALGEASDGDGLNEMRKEQGPKGKQANPFNVDELKKNPLGAVNGQKGKAKDDGPPKAPLLWGYLLVLLAAAIVPVLLAAARIRGGLVMGFAGFALLLLVVQMVIGFPLSTTANDFNAEMKKTEGEINLFGPPGKGGGPAMRSSFLPSFYFTLLVLMASGAIGLLQLIVGDGGSKPAPKKRRYDEEDEPAPKKRRRRDEDDDDDDDEPARKKRRRRDEDDD